MPRWPVLLLSVVLGWVVLCCQQNLFLHTATMTLAVRDLTDAALGPHAMQLLVHDAVAALCARNQDRSRSEAGRAPRLNPERPL